MTTAREPAIVSLLEKAVGIDRQCPTRFDPPLATRALSHPPRGEGERT